MRHSLFNRIVASLLAISIMVNPSWAGLKQNASIHHTLPDSVIFTDQALASSPIFNRLSRLSEGFTLRHALGIALFALAGGVALAQGTSTPVMAEADLRLEQHISNFKSASSENQVQKDLADWDAEVEEHSPALESILHGLGIPFDGLPHEGTKNVASLLLRSVGPSEIHALTLLKNARTTVSKARSALAEIREELPKNRPFSIREVGQRIRNQLPSNLQLNSETYVQNVSEILEKADMQLAGMPERFPVVAFYVPHRSKVTVERVGKNFWIYAWYADSASQASHYVVHLTNPESQKPVVVYSRKEFVPIPPGVRWSPQLRQFIPSGFMNGTLPNLFSSLISLHGEEHEDLDDPAASPATTSIDEPPNENLDEKPLRIEGFLQEPLGSILMQVAQSRASAPIGDQSVSASDEGFGVPVGEEFNFRRTWEENKQGQLVLKKLELYSVQPNERKIKNPLWPRSPKNMPPVHREASTPQGKHPSITDRISRNELIDLLSEASDMENAAVLNGPKSFHPRIIVPIPIKPVQSQPPSPIPENKKSRSPAKTPLELLLADLVMAGIFWRRDSSLYSSEKESSVGGLSLADRLAEADRLMREGDYAAAENILNYLSRWHLDDLTYVIKLINATNRFYASLGQQEKRIVAVRAILDNLAPVDRNDPIFRGIALRWIAAAELELGRTEDAMVHVDQAYKDLLSRQRVFVRPEIKSYLTEAYGAVSSLRTQLNRGAKPHLRGSRDQALRASKSNSRHNRFAK